MSITPTLPPPPYQSPFVVNGILSVAWTNWIKQLYLRTGGASASDNSTITAALTALQTSVTDLQTKVNNLTIVEFGRQL